MSEVKKERTGWRDESLSQRHRLWGWDCPALDIDFLVIEYDKAEPKAIVEYKNEHAAPQYATHPSYRALKKLADCAKIPLIACRYSDDLSKFKVTALNESALNYIPKRRLLSEIEWVTLLYSIRGKNVPQEIISKLSLP